MKVTIAFDDISLPLPPMVTPDVRQVVIEELVVRLDKAGIDDVHMIVAICLHRRMMPHEIKRVVGPKIFKRFWPDQLYNHDAEDMENLTVIGKTTEDETVEISKRAAESDLVIYVNINLSTMDGGPKSVAIGLGTYRTVKHNHGVKHLTHESSYMDPPRSIFHESIDRMGAVAHEKLNIFTVETTLNSDTFPHILGFLQKREREWGVFDKINYAANATGLACMPYSLRRKIFHSMPAPYAVTGVAAGETKPVHVETIKRIHQQQVIPVEGQADILLCGLAYICPYNVNTYMNPILVNVLAAGYYFNFHLNKPLLKKGGVLIIDHPLHDIFDPIQHPSYIDFYNDVLPVTHDPHKIDAEYTENFATNPEYIEKYRNSYAYHGVHPINMWMWASHGRAHMGKIIVINPKSRAAADRLGYEIAPTMDAAIGMARDIMGAGAAITYFHCPPIMMCDMS